MTLFYKRINSKDGYRNICRNCTDERERGWLREIKESSPCHDCKKYYPYYIMDFDHVNENDKLFSISDRKSKKNILEEIKKCHLVCSNCHRTRTYERKFKEKYGKENVKKC